MGTHPIFESDFDCLTDWYGLINPESWVNHEESELLVKCETAEETNVGPIWVTRKQISVQPSRPIHSEVLPTPRASFLKKSVSKPNSQILPLESVSECNLSKMVKRSPLSCPMMVV